MRARQDPSAPHPPYLPSEPDPDLAPDAPGAPAPSAPEEPGASAPSSPDAPPEGRSEGALPFPTPGDGVQGDGVQGDGAMAEVAAGEIALGPPPAPGVESVPLSWTTQPPPRRSGMRLVGYVVVALALGAAVAWFFYPSLDLERLSFLTAGAPATTATTAVPAPLPGTPPIAPVRTVLTVQTTPPGATVLVDLDSVGRTPLYRHTMAGGVYLLSFQHPGYATLDTVVIIREGEAHTLQVDLGTSGLAGRPSVRPEAAAFAAREPDALPRTEALPRAQAPPATPPATTPGTAAAPPAEAEASAAPTGTLMITSEPRGAAVEVDGFAMGRTPLLLEDVQPGTHVVRLSQEGFAERTVEVDIEAGDVASVQERLDAFTGTLRIRVQPWGSIYINGELHKRDTDIQYETEVEPGLHRVTATHPTLGTWENNVQVEPGATERVVVYFTPGAQAPPARPEAGEAAGAAAPTISASASAGGTLTANAEGGGALTDADGVYIVASVPPQLKGGLEGLYRRTSYPAEALAAGVEGRVYLRFVVDEKGRVRSPEVVKGIGMGCDQEALRAIRSARFEPATVDGEAVPVWHALYIKFELP